MLISLVVSTLVAAALVALLARDPPFGAASWPFGIRNPKVIGGSWLKWFFTLAHLVQWIVVTAFFVFAFVFFLFELFTTVQQNSFVIFFVLFFLFTVLSNQLWKVPHYHTDSASYSVKWTFRFSYYLNLLAIACLLVVVIWALVVHYTAATLILVAWVRWFLILSGSFAVV